MLIEKYNHYSQILDRTARRVKAFAQTSFAAHGIDLTVDQWSILKTINEQGAVTPKELAELVEKDQPTLTRIVDLLIKKSYVVRVIHPTDRRSLHIQLTDLGKEQVCSLAPIVSTFRMKAWENLTEKDFHEFQRILNRIYDNLNAK
ncbi:MarR family winged helix-turn-helix transcriptional regulator [Sphingobacterium sp. HJSM2_6]|uniref:MarR family winged helix-turn-helix transcriptional regulator n=1 Tax=Sphingobacterium sp. HJSM2_6 TaxID=3366264 RepID=UPI003BCBB6EA